MVKDDREDADGMSYYAGNATEIGVSLTLAARRLCSAFEQRGSPVQPSLPACSTCMTEAEKSKWRS